MKTALSVRLSAACLVLVVCIPIKSWTAPAGPIWPATASTPVASTPVASTAPSARDSIGSRAQSPQDSLVARKTRGDSVVIVRHGFNHRQQIITGSVIMSCLVVVLLAMNNYNPR